MRFRYRSHAANVGHFGIAPESADRKIREFWRKLAGPVTFFDLCSPADFLGREIGEFFRKWCARRDSNAGPPV
jgi:hypothetical protein